MSIPFKVISATSYVAYATANDLEVNSLNFDATGAGSFNHGWQSAAHCNYPQQLILEWSDGYAYSLSEIQILVHHFKIPTSVDLYYSLDSALVPDQCYWNKLGYVTLDDNEKSGWAAREVKNIFVEDMGIERCRALKIVIWDPHRNDLNIDRQVGLVAVKVVGKREKGPVNHRAYDAAIVDNDSGPSLESTWLPALETLKVKALEREDYHSAKHIRAAQNFLLSMEKDVMSLEAKKIAAVQVEDYDTALAIKMQLEQLRKLAEMRLSKDFGIGKNVHGELFVKLDVPAMPFSYEDEEFPSDRKPPKTTIDLRHISDDNAAESTEDITKNVSELRLRNGESALMKSQSIGSSDSRMASASVPKDPFPKPQKGSESISNKAIPKGGKGSASDSRRYDPNEDRPLPTTLASNGNIDGQTPASSGDLLLSSADTLDTIAEPLQQEYALAIKQFGLPIMTDLLQPGKPFKNKEKSLIKVFNGIGSVTPETLKSGSIVEYVCASLQVIQSVLLDNREKLIKMARDAYDLLVVNGMLEACAGKDDEKSVFFGAESIVPLLLRKVVQGPSNPESLCHLCSQWLISLLAQYCLQPLSLLPSIIKTTSRITSPTLLKARLDILFLFISDYGIPQKSGIVLDSVVKNLLSISWNHTNLDVKESSIQLAALLYGLYGQESFEPFWGDIKTTTKSVIIERSSKVPEKPPTKKKAIPQTNYIGTNANNVASTRKELKSSTRTEAKPTSPTRIEPVKNVSSKNTSSNNDPTQKISSNQPVCIFCGDLQSSDDPNELDYHYYQFCPMLISCPACNLLKEVAHLQDHMVYECEERMQVKQCPLCMLPVKIKDYSAHENSCPGHFDGQGRRKSNLKDKMIVRCPLCMQILEGTGDEAFKKHLLIDRCPASKRIPTRK